jgi:hypothetical protein
LQIDTTVDRKFEEVPNDRRRFASLLSEAELTLAVLVEVVGFAEDRAGGEMGPHAEEGAYLAQYM